MDEIIERCNISNKIPSLVPHSDYKSIDSIADTIFILHTRIKHQVKHLNVKTNTVENVSVLGYSRTYEHNTKYKITFYTAVTSTSRDLTNVLSL